MGNEVSRTPWRETSGWGKSERDQLKKQVQEVKTVSGIPYYNILLVGEVGSGKSSYFNAINSVMNDCVIKDTAKAGFKSESTTKKFEFYQVKPNLPFVRICDTMGLQLQVQEEQAAMNIDIMNLIKAMRGNVPHRYEFSPGEEFDETNPRFISNPSTADQAHCVAIVINAATVAQMKPTMLAGLQNLRDQLDKEEVPVYAILTHLDSFSTAVHQKASNTHCSTNVRDLVQSVSKKLHGLPENQIFPVVNYEEKRVDLSPDMDILLLLPLRQMLYSAKSYVQKLSQNKYDQYRRPVECGDDP